MSEQIGENLIDTSLRGETGSGGVAATTKDARHRTDVESALGPQVSPDFGGAVLPQQNDDFDTAECTNGIGKVLRFLGSRPGLVEVFIVDECVRDESLVRDGEP